MEMMSLKKTLSGLFTQPVGGRNPEVLHTHSDTRPLQEVHMWQLVLLSVRWPLIPNIFGSHHCLSFE